MPTSTEVAALIAKLEDERYDAMLACDIGTLERLLSQSLVYGHSNGGRDSRAAFLTKLAEGAFVYHQISHPIEQIQVFGPVALVFGSMEAEVSLRGQDRAVRNAVLAIWAQENDGWRLVAFQPTPIS
jgi:ketosteroid isomerase-like protein